MATFRLESAMVTSARIFGNRIGNGQRSGWKLLHRQRKLPVMEASMFNPEDLKKIGIPTYEYEKHVTKMEMRARRARRGKPVPQKGEGKRSAKRKK
jgi:Mitochondrial ribosomal subunit S27